MRRLGRGRPPGSGCKKEALEGLSERTLRKSAQVALAAIALSERSTDSSSGAQIGLKELIATQSHGPVAGCAFVAHRTDRLFIVHSLIYVSVNKCNASATLNVHEKK